MSTDELKIIADQTKLSIKVLPLKMYILIREDVDLGHAVLAAAHASLSGYLTFSHEPVVEEWAIKSFRKVVCKVTKVQFDIAKELKMDKRVMTESGLGNMEVAIVFKPCREWPTFFKLLPLYG